MGNDIVAECLKDKQLNRPEYLRFDSVINKESSRVHSIYLIHSYTFIHIQRLYAAINLSMRSDCRHSGHSGYIISHGQHPASFHSPCLVRQDSPSKRHAHIPSPPQYLHSLRQCLLVLDTMYIAARQYQMLPLSSRCWARLLSPWCLERFSTLWQSRSSLSRRMSRRQDCDFDEMSII
jgi:hypothetical protein